MKFNSEINRLRGIAIYMVVFEHLGFRGHFFLGVRKYFWGNSGVDLFFVISGYIISVTLAESLKKHSSYLTTIRIFWIKRFWRIFPLAFLWICLGLLMIYFMSFYYYQNVLFNVEGAGAALLNIYDLFVAKTQSATIFGAYWSLSLEEQFYLFFPLFIIIIRKTKLRIFLLSACLVLLNILSPQMRQFIRPEGIIYGVILYEIGSKFPNLLNNKISLGWLKVLSLILLLSATNPLLIKEPVQISHAVVVALCSLLVALAAENRGAFSGNNFIGKWLDWGGDRSYALYLSHLPLLYSSSFICNGLYKDFPDHKAMIRAVATIGCVILAAIIAEISHRLIEVPLRQKGRDIVEKISPDLPRHEQPLLPIEAVSTP